MKTHTHITKFTHLGEVKLSSKCRLLVGTNKDVDQWYLGTISPKGKRLEMAFSGEAMKTIVESYITMNGIDGFEPCELPPVKNKK